MKAVYTVALLVLLAARAAHAEPLAPSAAPAEQGDAKVAEANDGAAAPIAAPEPPAKPKAPVYSLPWGLRPATAGTVLRLDNALAIQDKATTLASMFLASYKLTPDVAVLVRVPLVHDETDGAKAMSAIGNPILAAVYAPRVAPSVRIPTFAGVTVPVGMGGGTEDAGKSPSTYRIVGSGVYARSAMDNALFAVNYCTIVLGAGVAYAGHGVTVAGEATLLLLERVRGESIDKEPGKTNATFGIHVGYEIVPELTVSVEGRYQRWLSSPRALAADDSKRDAMTAGLGVRTKLALGEKVTMRPGLAYFHPIDDPMSKNGYRVVVLDIPVSF
jgi:hypothetical protein